MLVARDIAVRPPGGEAPTVQGVDLSVAAGEWVVLTGPNGGGKTSLLLALAGLWPIAAGTLTLNGTPFGPEGRARAARRMSVVLQDPSSQLLQPTVADELAFTARNLGKPEGEVAEAMALWGSRLGLVPDFGRSPTMLSAGRQQLVLLAAALVPQPALLLADEPTAHVDGGTRARVREWITAEVQRGMGVIWATQDADEAAAAHRRHVVGMRPGPDAPAPTVPLTHNGEVALRLRVMPPGDGEGEGPRILTDRPLDVEIGSRGVTSLLGPNGAGKTVLLSAAAGILEPRQVTIEWSRATSAPPILALQFPDLQVFEEKVADEVTFAAVARGVAPSNALDAARVSLQRLGLDAPSLLGRETWGLSAGEKRLVEIIGALIAPSGLVLLDEPTAGLDARRSAALAPLILERAASTPVLLASQDRRWVDGLGGRQYVLGK